MYKVREWWDCVCEWLYGVAGAASAPLSPALAGVSSAMLLLSLCFVFVAVWAPFMKLPDDPACYDLPLSREFTHNIAQSYHITASWNVYYMCVILISHYYTIFTFIDYWQEKDGIISLILIGFGYVVE